MTLAVIGMFGVLASPRASIASGCHVDDRPRIGLTTVGDDLVHVAPERDPAKSEPSRWAPRPCTDDTPASQARPITIGPADVSAILRAAPIDSRTDIPPDAPRLASRTSWSDLSRPPR